jgi:hypothetical protein
MRIWGRRGGRATAAEVTTTATSALLVARIGPSTYLLLHLLFYNLFKERHHLIRDLWWSYFSLYLILYLFLDILLYFLPSHNGLHFHFFFCLFLFFNLHLGLLRFRSWRSSSLSFFQNKRGLLFGFWGCQGLRFTLIWTIQTHINIWVKFQHPIIDVVLCFPKSFNRSSTLYIGISLLPITDGLVLKKRDGVVSRVVEVPEFDGVFIYLVHDQSRPRCVSPYLMDENLVLSLLWSRSCLKHYFQISYFN